MSLWLGEEWRKRWGDEERGRVDKGKPTCTCLVCHVHSGFPASLVGLNHLVSHLSHCLSPSPRTSHDVHTTATATQCPRLRPDTTSRLTFFSPFAQARAAEGAQRTTPLPISSGAATQQGRVRGARQRATLAGGGASGARLGGDGCGDGRGPRSGARSGRVCEHGTEPDEEREGVVWDPCGGRESCNAKAARRARLSL